MHAKSPVASVVTSGPTNVPIEHETGVWRAELNKMLATDDTLKPVPVTVYVAPTGPCVGVIVIVGVVIVNDAVPVPPPPDWVAVTV